MTRADSIATAFIERGWLLMLAFTAAVLLVGITRKGWRRIFGAERALQLWLLPPLAMLVTQLPQRSPVSLTFLLGRGAITQAAAALPLYTAKAEALGLRTGLLAIWLTGVVVAAVMAIRAQRCYWSRLRGATVVTDASLRWPVLLASHANVGPAMVGAWRMHIVLPSDFNTRYDAVERALILAHESTHARRHDGLWCLIAQIICAMFWFHPLAWFALAALRLDQELACDAVVLRQRGTQRRSYANAMLKTQAGALVPPVGCSWSSRHPVTERIAMLKFPAPSRRRRRASAVILVFSLTGFAGAAYAVSQSEAVDASITRNAPVHATEYQLDVYAQKTTDGISTNHIERATLALCSAARKTDTFTVGDWTVRTMVTPDSTNAVRIDLSVFGAGNVPLTQSQWRGSIGQALHADLKSPDGKDHYAFVLTPLKGCPARDANKTASN